MFSKIKSFGVSGVGGYEVAVEVYISNGLPGFDIVGLPDAAVKESRERVRSAIKNNVAPGPWPKYGPHGRKNSRTAAIFYCSAIKNNLS